MLLLLLVGRHGVAKGIRKGTRCRRRLRDTFAQGMRKLAAGDLACRCVNAWEAGKGRGC